jgi:hypothetical protein
LHQILVLVKVDINVKIHPVLDIYYLMLSFIFYTLYLNVF